MKVLVVGGGVLGCANALEFASRGHEVTLVEKRTLGGGASGAGTGLLMQRDAQVFHSQFREFYVRSVREYYPKWMQKLQSYGGPVSLKTEGFWLGYTKPEKEQSFLDQCQRERSKAYAKCLEIPDFLPEEMTLEFPLYHFPEESYLVNGDLLESLQLAMQREGVQVFEGVEGFQLQENAEATWKTGTWQGDQVLCCAGVWSAELLKPLGYDIPLVPVKGQVALLKEKLWDKGVLQINDHFYLLPRGEHTLVGATSEARDWTENFTEAGDEFLKGYLKQIFPTKEFSFARTWAGLRPRTKDRKPFMGWLESGKLALCCGHYKNGLSMAPLVAECMANLLEGKEAPIDYSDFTPFRKKGVKRSSVLPETQSKIPRD